MFQVQFWLKQRFGLQQRLPEGSSASHTTMLTRKRCAQLIAQKGIKVTVDMADTKQIGPTKRFGCKGLQVIET